MLAPVGAELFKAGGGGRGVQQMVCRGHRGDQGATTNHLLTQQFVRSKCFYWSPKPGTVLMGQGQCAPGGVDAVLVMGTPGCFGAVLPPLTKAEQQEGSICLLPCAMLQSLAPEISGVSLQCPGPMITRSHRGLSSISLQLSSLGAARISLLSTTSTFVSAV